MCDDHRIVRVNKLQTSGNCKRDSRLSPVLNKSANYKNMQYSFLYTQNFLFVLDTSNVNIVKGRRIEEIFFLSKFLFMSINCQQYALDISSEDCDQQKYIRRRQVQIQCMLCDKQSSLQPSICTLLYKTPQHFIRITRYSRNV